ncbi:MAG: hypothetical protein AB1638_00405 [Nitrospirota bacterium]
MKRMVLVVLFVAILLAVFMSYPNRSKAEVNINIGINVPPSFVVPAPPAVVLIPNTYVYFIPGIEVDIFFYHGYWYRPYEGRWYRSGYYNGPWVYIIPARVPVVLLHLSPAFRHVPPGHDRIPYGQLKKNWRKWERVKYWDKHRGKEWRKEEKGEHGKGKGRY